MRVVIVAAFLWATIMIVLGFPLASSNDTKPAAHTTDLSSNDTEPAARAIGIAQIHSAANDIGVDADDETVGDQASGDMSTENHIIGDDLDLVHMDDSDDDDNSTGGQAKNFSRLVTRPAEPKTPSSRLSFSDMNDRPDPPGFVPPGGFPRRFGPNDPIPTSDFNPTSPPHPPSTSGSAIPITPLPLPLRPSRRVNPVTPPPPPPPPGPRVTRRSPTFLSSIPPSTFFSSRLRSTFFSSRPPPRTTPAPPSPPRTTPAPPSQPRTTSEPASPPRTTPAPPPPPRNSLRPIKRRSRTRTLMKTERLVGTCMCHLVAKPEKRCYSFLNELGGTCKLRMCGAKWECVTGSFTGNFCIRKFATNKIVKIPGKHSKCKRVVHRPKPYWVFYKHIDLRDLTR